MSEKINELIKSVKDLKYDASTGTFETDRRALFDFAELIVRECVKFCEHESNDDEHDEYDMGMWVKAESIKTAIMEEFGIKE